MINQQQILNLANQCQPFMIVRHIVEISEDDVMTYHFYYLTTTSNENCFFVWLDLRNVFGSVSHDAIHVTPKHMGFSEHFINLVKDIYTDADYTDAETVVKLSKDEETDPIKVNAGVKQGCPISSIPFNLTTELLIRTVQSRYNENSDIAFKLHGNPVYVLRMQMIWFW